MSAELRDRFFALSTGHAPADEVTRYRAQVDATDTEPVTTLDGLAISWHPTVRFKAVRFVDAERLGPEVRDLFARPSEGAPYLAAVFVDPHELSLRTFENIVPLDRLFTNTPLDFELTHPTELAAGAYTFHLRLPADARRRLERLDALDLYVPPLNSHSRGGERFIFHSALLAEALTEAVARDLPQQLREGFSHVNPVFRCNRFQPGDPNFHQHRDTPYYDAERHHISRYTVLIYLTGGSANPALDLTDAATLTEIAPYTCVIFDQRYEHEGAPYLDGRKVFLRTELVFTETEISHDPEIAALFSKACYWTGESVFAPELARHADAYYSRVAAAHWHGLTAEPGREPFVHKRFRGVDFVANGYDFWFAKTEGRSLAECAAIALLDYFNCTIGGTAFRSLCHSEVIEADNADWIPAHLRARGGESAVPPVDKSLLFPAPEDPDPSVCCPFHTTETFDATRFDEVVDLYRQAQDFTMAHVMPAPIVMLGEDVLLDPDKFLIEGNAIHVLGRKSLTPVNFAACWNSGGLPQNYLDVATTVGTAHFLVPPILFHETDGCYHLQFDFFRNSWMVKHQQATVPAPMIQRTMFEDGDDWPWIAAVDRSIIPEGKSDTDLWWTESPALDEDLAEIFDDYEDYFDD